MRKPATARHRPLLEALQRSSDPVTRWKIRCQVMDEPVSPAELTELRAGIRQSEVITGLLSAGEGAQPEPHAYAKWTGAHWVLVMLAECGYAPKGRELAPLRRRVLEWMRSEESSSARPDRLIDGRWRVHASMHGNVLFALNTLGLAGDETEPVLDDLLRFQWPDGGWNCDQRRAAQTSSATHTLIALRGLISARGTHRRDARLEAAISAAAEFLLSRRLLYRRRDGELMDETFVQLLYPSFHCYNYLFALQVLGEGELLDDPRCADALGQLEQRLDADQGLRVDRKAYHHTPTKPQRYTPVRWENAKLGRAHEYLTADALAVLRLAGRLEL